MLRQKKLFVSLLIVGVALVLGTVAAFAGSVPDRNWLNTWIVTPTGYCINPSYALGTLDGTETLIPEDYAGDNGVCKYWMDSPGFYGLVIYARPASSGTANPRLKITYKYHSQVRAVKYVSLEPDSTEYEWYYTTDKTLIYNNVVIENVGDVGVYVNAAFSKNSYMGHTTNEKAWCTAGVQCSSPAEVAGYADDVFASTWPGYPNHYLVMTHETGGFGTIWVRVKSGGGNIYGELKARRVWPNPDVVNVLVIGAYEEATWVALPASTDGIWDQVELYNHGLIEIQVDAVYQGVHPGESMVLSGRE